MKHANERHQPLVGQIRVELCKVGRHDHRLVRQGPARQAGHVKRGFGFRQGRFGPPANDEQPPLELGQVHVLPGFDEDLLDPGH